MNQTSLQIAIGQAASFATCGGVDLVCMTTFELWQETTKWNR